MPGPLEAAGVAHEPSQYAPLSMDRYITGLWTQRSPIRDAAVPYVYGKFYGASRFDSLIDGLNREITSRLTFQRRPGLVVYNLNHFPPIYSFYSFKFVQNGEQVVHVLADSPSQVWDATPPGQTLLLNKPSGGRTRFLGVGSQLIITNGLQQMKWTQSVKTWQPSTQYNGGDFIVDPNGNIQSVTANAPTTATVANVIVAGVTGTLRFILRIEWTAATSPEWSPNTNITFSGMTTFTQLNGQALPYDPNLATQYGLATGRWSYFLYFGPATSVIPDSGTGTGVASTGGVSGFTAPSWSSIPGGTTTDGGVTWTCNGSAVQNLGITGPTSAPIINTPAAMRYWQPLAQFPQFYTILDSNNVIEEVQGLSVYNVSGTRQPTWNGNFQAPTQDGNIIYWTNCGNLGTWAPYTYTYLYTAIVDVNGNIQICISGAPVGAPSTVHSSSGSSVPNWGTTVGAEVTGDGDLSWMCVGPGTVLSNGPFSYAYSWHCIDGSVSTASPAGVIPTGILGTPGGFAVTLNGLTPADPQCDQIWIWRTDQGGAVMVFRVSIANPTPGTAGTWTWTDTDPTSSALNPLIAAPLNAINANAPPPVGATAPEYHLQRVWMIVGSQVIWSGGPDTVVGNGITAFPGNNSIQFPEKLTRLVSSITNDAALLVFGTANTYAILGEGTPESPFYPVIYMKNLGILSYDALTFVGSTFYGFTNNSKGAELDPGAGYVEYGFPIGDQFIKMSTGGQNSALYNPATTYVTWHEKESGDTGLFVADGAVGWFRYSPVAPPESGFLWSPFAAIVGGTSAVQSVEVATGDWELLVGPSRVAGVNITGIQIFIDSSHPGHPYPIATITLTLQAPMDSPLATVMLNGLTTVPELNGYTTTIVGSAGNNIVIEQDSSTLNAIGPASETGTVTYTSANPAGPILMRDTSVYTDNGETYGEGNCFGTLGNVVLCQSGEVAEVAHIQLMSMRVGDRPTVGMLYDEIAESATIDFDVLEYTSVDPPTLAESESLYSDRYTATQDGVCPKCLHCQILIDWPDQDVGDELLSHTIYGAKYGERKEQPG